MNEVKRYAIISDDWDYVESPSGGFVDHDDYAALEAECERLAGLLREVSDEWRTRQSEYLLERIDAALAEQTP